MTIARYAMLSAVAAMAVTLPVSYAASAPKKPSYEARVKTCNAATKGLYTGEGRQVVFGQCLSNTMAQAWTAQPQR